MINIDAPYTNPTNACPACGSTNFKRYIGYPAGADPIYDECIKCGRQYDVDAQSLAEGQDFEQRWQIEPYGFTNRNVPITEVTE